MDLMWGFGERGSKDVSSRLPPSSLSVPHYRGKRDPWTRILTPSHMLWQHCLSKGLRVKLILPGGSLAWSWANRVGPGHGLSHREGVELSHAYSHTIVPVGFILRVIKLKSHQPSSLLPGLSQASGGRGSSCSLEGWRVWCPLGCGLHSMWQNGKT